MAPVSFSIDFSRISTTQLSLNGMSLGLPSNVGLESNDSLITKSFLVPLPTQKTIPHFHVSSIQSKEGHNI